MRGKANILWAVVQLTVRGTRRRRLAMAVAGRRRESPVLETGNFDVGDGRPVATVTAPDGNV